MFLYRARSGFVASYLLNKMNVTIHFIIVIICSCIICNITLSAQQPTISFERINMDQGMKTDHVKCLLEDSQGFIWFGTPRGLHKYDGYGFTVYQSEVGDTTSLSSSSILTMYEDRAGTLWIGTFFNGLNRFDRKSGKFIRFINDPDDPQSLSHNQVQAICEDREGYLWVGTTKGLNRLTPGRKGFTRFLYYPEVKPNWGDHLIKAIYEDRSGALWIGTAGGGLHRFNYEQEKFTIFRHNPEDPHSISGDGVISIHEDRDGNFWIGTYSGLNRFDRESRQFVRYAHDPGDPKSMSSNYVQVIHEDANGTFWIGTMGGGLNIMDRNSGRFTRIMNDPQDTRSLGSNFVTSLIEDRTGTLWAGTGTLWGEASGGGYGVNRFDRGQAQFNRFVPIPENLKGKGFSIWRMYEDRSGAIWFTTIRHGLFKYDHSTGEFSNFRHDPGNPNSISQNLVMSVYEDRAGIIWAGTGDTGLNRIDPETGLFTQYKHDPDIPSSLSHNRVTSFFEDHDSTFWVATYGGGLNLFDREQGTFKHFRHDPDDPSTLSSDHLSGIYKDRNGDLWILSWGGLSRFDGESSIRYRHDPRIPTSLSNNVITAIYEDRSGAFWVGTGGGGLNRLNRSTGEFQYYTEKDGLAGNGIQDIVEDRNGDLWLMTSGGLSRFDSGKDVFKNYDMKDGLQNKSFKGAARRDGSGEIFLVGRNGIEFFDPDSIRDNPHIPPVVFTRFTRYTSGDDDSTMIIDNQISEKQHLDLSYQDQTLTFDFTALNYRSSYQNQYAYRLEGAQDDWIQLGGQRSITFTNLPTGSYTLRVKGANNDGVWNEAGASLKFTIHPPWWRTRLAYGFYFITFLGFLFGAYRFELNRQRKDILLQESRKRTRLAEERAKERTEMLEIVEKKNSELDEKNRKINETQEQLIVQEKLASLGQLTAGIAHEIKNPLNFVNNFSELSIELVNELRDDFTLHQDKFDSETRENIEEILQTLENNAGKINEHGRRADGIVKGMLEHSRGKSGEFQTVDLNDLLEEYINIAYHGMRARNEEFNVTIEKEYDETIGKIPLVPPDISRVFLNIFNNAFEAVSEKNSRDDGMPPTVSITTKNLKKKAEIRIRDNGPGIPEKVSKEIFNPFFTTKPTGQGNTGLGLSISHDIVVKVHRGEIRVESKEGEFTEFLILLPKEK